MSDSNLGQRGATHQSWRRDTSIRVYIKELQDEFPTANERQLVLKLVARAREDDDVLFAAAEYAVKNAIASQHSYARDDKSPQRAPTPVQTAEIKKRAQEAAERVINKILLLNIEMPNGLKLRDCTGDYIAKLGGQYAKAGKKAGYRLMGRVFDETSLREYIDVV